VGALAKDLSFFRTGTAFHASIVRKAVKRAKEQRASSATAQEGDIVQRVLPAMMESSLECGASVCVVMGLAMPTTANVAIYVLEKVASPALRISPNARFAPAVDHVMTKLSYLRTRAVAVKAQGFSRAMDLRNVKCAAVGVEVSSTC
jgi:hypothetical protein